MNSDASQSSSAASPPAATWRAPLSNDAPLPHRKVIRSWLLPLSERNTWRALALITVDNALFASLLVGVVVLGSVWLKLLCGLAAGLVTARLFIIGHDGCHHSLTPHRRLNQWLGRIAFLPSLTACSLWDVGHNMMHHCFTNLKGVDFVWAPLTQQELNDLTPWRNGWRGCIAADGSRAFITCWKSGGNG